MEEGASVNKERLIGEDNHHIVFQRRAWEEIVKEDGHKKIEIGRMLREQQSLVVPINKEKHREMHEVIPIIPTLGVMAVEAVLVEYTSRVKDPTIFPIKAIEQLKLSFNEIPKTLITAEDKDVIDLIIHSLDEQKKPLGKALDLRENQTRGKNKDKRIKYKTQRRNGRSLAHIGRR